MYKPGTSGQLCRAAGALARVLIFCLLLAVAGKAGVVTGQDRNLAPGNIVMEKVDVTVRLDPQKRALYGTMVLSVRNMSEDTLEGLTFRFPSPLAPGVVVTRVWDREDELPWRRLRRQEKEGEFLLQVPLAKPLRSYQKILIGLSYDLRLDRLPATNAFVRLTYREARLSAAGWYPLLTRSPQRLPQRIRMVLRIPKEWHATSPFRLKREKEATLLVDYDLKWDPAQPDNADPGMVLFEARAPASPEGSHSNSNSQVEVYLKEIVKTENAPAAIGPYSQAVKANGLVFVSGQIALDPATGELIEGGIGPQTERVMKNLEGALAAADSSLAKVVKATVYLVDMNDYAAMNEVYGKFFTSDPPARAAVAVAGLPKNVKVEIDVIALADSQR